MTHVDDHACCVVGYGNRQRRDDGVGPIIVEGLQRYFEAEKGVSLLAVPQLSVDLVEDLKNAGRILFIDAVLDDAGDDRAWCRLRPDTQSSPFLTHHVQPAGLLGLLEILYRHPVAAWLISICGHDFEFGEGLSPKTARAAAKVEREIIAFVCRGAGNR